MNDQLEKSTGGKGVDDAMSNVFVAVCLFLLSLT